MECIYCQKELIFPWEQRRYDCDECHYAITVTYHENLHDNLLEEEVSEG